MVNFKVPVKGWYSSKKLPIKFNSTLYLLAQDSINSEDHGNYSVSITYSVVTKCNLDYVVYNIMN